MTRDTAARVDVIMRDLVSRGGRRTASRQAILEALVEAGPHVTASDLAATVQARFPSINLSTVYRTLDALEEIGILDHVHLGHGKAIYHLADELHQHLVCSSCDRVVELPDEKLRPLLQSVKSDYGFEIDRRHFAIVGVCKRCRAALMRR